MGKVSWNGVVVAVQPRIRLTRSFDQRSHSYQGYVLRVHGTVADEQREVIVAIGEAAHAEYQFHVGDRVRGDGVPVAMVECDVSFSHPASGSLSFATPTPATFHRR